MRLDSADSARRAREALAIRTFPTKYDLGFLTLPQLRQLVMDLSESLKMSMNVEGWESERLTIACENFTALRTFHLGEIEREITAYKKSKTAKTPAEKLAYETLVMDDISLYATYTPNTSKTSLDNSKAWAEKLERIYSLPCIPNLTES